MGTCGTHVFDKQLPTCLHSDSSYKMMRMTLRLQSQPWSESPNLVQYTYTYEEDPLYACYLL